MVGNMVVQFTDTWSGILDSTVSIFFELEFKSTFFAALFLPYTPVHSPFSGNESTADLTPTNRYYNDFLSVYINHLCSACMPSFLPTCCEFQHSSCPEVTWYMFILALVFARKCAKWKRASVTSRDYLLARRDGTRRDTGCLVSRETINYRDSETNAYYYHFLVGKRLFFQGINCFD